MSANRPGSGTGGPGQGSGRPGESQDGKTAHTKDKLRGAFHKGKMVGSYLEKGQAPKGEASQELQEMILTGSRYAEESLERERFPADYKEIPRRYFERIRDQ